MAVAGLEHPVASVTEMPVTSQATPLTFAKIQAAGPEEHRVESGAWPARCAFSIPDQLPKQMREDAQRFATTVFAALGCEASRASTFHRRRHEHALLATRSTRCPGRGVLPVVRSAALLDDHRPARTTHRSSAAPAR